MSSIDFWVRPTSDAGYTLLEDTFLVMEEGAEWEQYDPLEELERGIISPITDLLNLDLDDPSQIVQWTDRYGLLGLLPLLCVEVRQWPRWWEPWNDTKEKGSIMQTSYRVLEGPDKQREKWVPWSKIAHESQPVSHERLTESELQRALKHFYWLKPPGTRLLNPWGQAYVQETSLTTGYAPFFPRLLDHPQEHLKRLLDASEARGGAFWLIKDPIRENSIEQIDYPYPFSDSFWKHYAEPLPLFREMVGWFKRSLQSWHESARFYEQKFRREPPRLDRHQEMAFFNQALQRVSPQIKQSPQGGTTRTWSSPSLFATFVFNTAMEDLVGELPQRQCLYCPTWFTPHRPDQVFCSDKHRNRAHVKRNDLRGKLRELIEDARMKLNEDKQDEATHLLDNAREHREDLLSISDHDPSEKTAEVLQELNDLEELISQ